MQATLYALPAILALLIKCYLLYLAYVHRKHIDKYLIAVIVSLLLLNVIECMCLLNIGYDKYLIKVYCVLVVIFMICIARFSANLTQKFIPFYTLIHVFGICLIPLIFFTSYIIMEVPAEGAKPSEVIGEYYYLFQLFMIIQLVASLLLFAYSMYNEKTSVLIRAKSSVIILSLLPLLYTVFIVVFSMAMNVRLNVEIILPVATTIFLCGCLYAGINTKVIDFSIFLPGTPSFKRKNEIFFFLYAGNEKSEMWDCLLKLERLYIEEAMAENKGKGQLSNAAKELGITPGKLDYRLKNIHQMDDDKFS